MEKKIRKLLKAKGMASSHIEMLDALLKLRQVCCDPRLVNIASAKKVQQSAKLELLMQLVPELLEEGRRILIFSQFTSMLGLIEAELKDRNIGYSKLTGQTRKRDEAIGRFQNGEVEVFLISLKAGGVGLNLTAADTVIHYDPWWNPAAENQATDRAHRIGQDKPVFVYKLITEKTVEEKILALQQRKQALADAVYAGTDATANNKSQGLQAEELLALFEEIA
ncbi:MAG: SWF/SNF helicase family protein [Pseudomonadales bacterium]|nr:SWF/SNF helicase family protein [Pseudomonadales bacterium]